MTINGHEDAWPAEIKPTATIVTSLRDESWPLPNKNYTMCCCHAESKTTDFAQAKVGLRSLRSLVLPYDNRPVQTLQFSCLNFTGACYPSFDVL